MSNMEYEQDQLQEKKKIYEISTEQMRKETGEALLHFRESLPRKRYLDEDQESREMEKLRRRKEQERLRRALYNRMLSRKMGFNDGNPSPDKDRVFIRDEIKKIFFSERQQDPLLKRIESGQRSAFRNISPKSIILDDETRLLTGEQPELERNASPEAKQRLSMRRSESIGAFRQTVAFIHETVKDPDVRMFQIACAKLALYQDFRKMYEELVETDAKRQYDKELNDKIETQQESLPPKPPLREPDADISKSGDEGET